MRSIVGLFILVLTCAAAAEAKAEKRVALVFGNSKYQHVPNLPNPTRDAAAVKLLLTSAGFDVVDTRDDVGVSDMRRAVRDFTDRTRAADIALIYTPATGSK